MPFAYSLCTKRNLQKKQTYMFYMSVIFIHTSKLLEKFPT